MRCANCWRAWKEEDVWELVGNVGSSRSQGPSRARAFVKRWMRVGSRSPGVRPPTGVWREGKQVTATWLKETQDVQGIFAQNDEMGLGAIEALKEAGLDPGCGCQDPVGGCHYGAFKSMLAGELNVTVECNPLLAPQVYEAALKAANGETLPKWVPSQEGVFRSDNANLRNNCLRSQFVKAWKFLR